MQGDRELQTASLSLEGLYEGHQSLGFNTPVEVIIEQIASVFKVT